MRLRHRAAPAPEVRLLRRTAIRVGVQATLLVAVTVTLLTGTALLVVLHSQHLAAAHLLSDAINRADDVTDPPAAVWLVVQGPQGRMMSTGMPAGLPDLGILRQTATTGVSASADVRANHHEYRVQTARRGPSTIEAVLDLSSDHAERDRLVSALLMGGGVGLLLAGVVGAWLGTRAAAPLSAALALQRRFVADAGHELRTPLTLLSTRIQLLRRRLQQGGDPQAVGEADDLIADSAHLAAILDDLLLAADPQVPPAQASTVDLVTLAREVLALARPLAAEHSIELHGPVEGRVVPVRGAPSMLRRAITALIDNAIRHARGTVSVAVERLADAAVLEVSDDGPGIDPAIASRMFERFASTGGARSARSGGARHYGLGLALVSEIAVRHNGEVTAGDRPGGGATLRLVLPVAPT